MIVKEFGSDFHFIDKNHADDAGEMFDHFFPDADLFFSGRAALYALIQLGVQKYGWKNIYLPEYYCHDVTDFISALPVNIQYYDDGPYYDKIPETQFYEIDSEENAIVIVNYFGAARNLDFDFERATIIEDHTHDCIYEQVKDSNADYCFASLRKLLPIPAGGMVWSPKQLELPKPTPETDASIAAAYMKLSAMLLKREYLLHGSIEKQNFRDLFMTSEAAYGYAATNTALPKGLSDMVRRQPVGQLKNIKEKNLLQLYNSVVLPGAFCPFSISDHPIGFVMLFEDNGKRNAMKDHLVQHNIYPAILWPHQRTHAAASYSDRMLMIHCDIRYNREDIAHIASVINNCC